MSKAHLFIGMFSCLCFAQYDSNMMKEILKKYPPEDQEMLTPFFEKQAHPNPNRSADIFKIIAWKPEGLLEKTLFYIDGRTPSEKQWTEIELDIGEFLGQDIVISFIFDSVDNIWNDAKGIAIDDVEIIGAHYLPWAEFSGEVHLDWTGGLPKYFVYRGTDPNFDINPPELRAYTPYTHIYENSLNDDKSYYYKVR